MQEVVHGLAFRPIAESFSKTTTKEKKFAALHFQLHTRKSDFEVFLNNWREKMSGIQSHKT